MKLLIMGFSLTIIKIFKYLKTRLKKKQDKKFNVSQRKRRTQ